ncbi:hypothetical protein NQ315_002841 [Exocentrus adspersus]|uniref:C2H2-type domain-containing protein n=1 Tax=Exocentrus adspersus TaxID=1586481 RepID=A0AAV8VJ45_9CUCU|nr:hypothetical protein NQ315_002841 [Exocentrus adspersus]
MEESPHKCPVCSRSFNQRSNLKTHLLTHTDHKPYECNSCGKVFRRNCDLRRHALTHAVGDVPADSLGDGFTSGSEMERERMSPRPRSPSADSRDERDVRGCSPTPEITQCHEPCSSTSPYTMRPSNDRHDYCHDINDEDGIDEDPEIDPGQEDCPDVLNDSEEIIPEPQPIQMPQLQIRRDLHHPQQKTCTITSESMESNFLGPFRKRTLNQERPSSAYNLSRSHTPPMNLRMYHHTPSMPPQSLSMSHTMSINPGPVLKPPDTGTSMIFGSVISGSSKISQCLPGPSSNNVASDLSMKKNEDVPVRPPPQPPRPKKTGFTIADIMGR